MRPLKQGEGVVPHLHDWLARYKHETLWVRCCLCLDEHATCLACAHTMHGKATLHGCMLGPVIMQMSYSLSRSQILTIVASKRASCKAWRPPRLLLALDHG